MKDEPQSARCHQACSSCWIWAWFALWKYFKVAHKGKLKHMIVSKLTAVLFGTWILAQAKLRSASVLGLKTFLLFSFIWFIMMPSRVYQLLPILHGLWHSLLKDRWVDICTLTCADINSSPYLHGLWHSLLQDRWVLCRYQLTLYMWHSLLQDRSGQDEVAIWPGIDQLLLRGTGCICVDGCLLSSTAMQSIDCWIVCCLHFSFSKIFQLPKPAK